MDSSYKQQLCARLDFITNLERSGYGATYRKQCNAEDRESLKSFAAMLAAIAVLFVLCAAIGF